MLNEIRNTTGRGDYNPTNVTIEMIRDTAVKGNTQFRNFSVRINNDYATDVGDAERQPTELFCTTFQADVMQLLDTLKPGDKVNLSAYLDSVWRVYKANDTLEGIRDIVPDIGQETVELPDGDRLEPTAKPYELDKTVPNAIIYPGITLNVMSITPASNITSAELKNTGSGFGQVQDKLNQATAPEPSNANESAPAAPAATVPFGG